jgi:Cu(I)/Ag(I) efflux system membrane fusion protein
MVPGPKPVIQDLMLTDSQIRLANITVGTAVRGPIGESIVLAGTVVVDERNTTTVSSRISGRVDRLYIRESGVPVHAGQKLYEVYSEELLSLQQEYLLAYARAANEPRYETFFKGAESKLLLYGQTEQQLADLVREGHGSGLTVYASPVSGIVKEILITQGQYVSEGQPILRVERVDKVWVDAEVYGKEVWSVRQGDSVLLQADGQQPMASAIRFIYPELNAGSQTMKIRCEVVNTAGWIPGMRIRVVLSGKKHIGLTVPSGAVIRTRSGGHVYVMRAPNTFTPQRVQTGIEDQGRVEILEGLGGEEAIALTGAYLIYGELVLRAGVDPATFAGR